MLCVGRFLSTAWPGVVYVCGHSVWSHQLHLHCPLSQRYILELVKVPPRVAPGQTWVLTLAIYKPEARAVQVYRRLPLAVHPNVEPVVGPHMPVQVAVLRRDAPCLHHRLHCQHVAALHGRPVDSQWVRLHGQSLWPRQQTLEWARCQLIGVHLNWKCLQFKFEFKFKWVN